jgi:hypothetical protein
MGRNWSVQRQGAGGVGGVIGRAADEDEEVEVPSARS